MAQSALFHRAAIRFGNSTLLGLASTSALMPVLVSVLALAGCDSATSKTDKQVTANLAAAQAKMGVGPAPTVSNADLDTAARESGDSLPVQIHAKSAFADSELQLAQSAADQVQANDQQIDRLVREVGLLTGQIQANNQLVDALQKYDPSKAVPQGKSVNDAVNDTKASVTGSDDKPDWVKTDATTLAALSSVDKQAAAFQAEVTRLTDAIRSNTDKRTQLLDQADKFIQQSQHEHGDKSVDLYTQGSNASRQAAELTVQIDTDTAALARNQADLGVEQGQHDALTATVAAMDAKAKSVDSDWKNVQTQIADLNTMSKALLGDEPVEAPKVDKKGDLKTDATIASKSSAIHQLGEDNRKMRSVAETHFDKAIALYGEAATLASRITVELGGKLATADQNKPERAAWTAEKNALDSNTYEFLQADAQMQKGNFNSRNAGEAKIRLDMITALKPVLATAALTPTPTLDETNPDLAKQAKDAAGSDELGARGSFAKAIATFDKVATSTAPIELRSAAKANQIFTQYNWSALETAAGDAQKAGTHLELARGLVNGAATEGIPLPPMPAELAAPGAMTPSVPMSPSTPMTPAVPLIPAPR